MQKEAERHKRWQTNAFGLCTVRTGWRPVTHLLNRATPESFEFPTECQCAKVAEITFLGTKQHTSSPAHVHFICTFLPCAHATRLMSNPSPKSRSSLVHSLPL